MSINSPIINSPKSSVRDIPLWIALLITTVVHLLVIFKLQINVPKIEKKTNVLVINIIKLPPRLAPQVTVPVITVPPITSVNAIIHQPSVAGKKPAANLPKVPKLKKTSTHNHSITKTAALSVPKVAVNPETFAAVPEPKIPAPPEPVVIEAKVKADTVEPIASVPVIVPDAPVVPEPKTEVNPVVPDAIAPVVNQPTAIEKEVVPVDVPQPDVIDKQTNLPEKPSKKTGKKPSKKSTLNNAANSENPPPLSLDDLATQIAQVGEKFGNLPAPETTSESRVKKLNSVREHKVSARQYILDWQHKVERIGNLNYPEVARQKDFSARLVMEVGINSDGSIHSIKIKKPSGTPALDEAAKNIVRMGEPYPALPKNLTQELDVLIIQRTWLFSDESGMTTQ